MDNFDPKFYKMLYFDIRNLSDEDAKKHFFKYGFLENRICSKKMLDKKKIKNLEILNSRNLKINNIIFNEKESLINIIIRTSNRPNYFLKNINNINIQNYKNLKLYITYDDINTLNYIKKNNNTNLVLVKVNKNKNTDYFYNEYCNQVLKLINEGYIIFLDDDDMFTNKNCLKYINKYLSEERFLIWDYLRGDKIIGPKKGIIKSGRIASCSFCYHSKYKSNWKTTSNGDFQFVEKLLNSNNLKISKLNKILTRAINLNVICGEGKCQDI